LVPERHCSGVSLFAAGFAAFDDRGCSAGAPGGLRDEVRLITGNRADLDVFLQTCSDSNATAGDCGLRDRLVGSCLFQRAYVNACSGFEQQKALPGLSMSKLPIELVCEFASADVASPARV
jgi:hypothetical protein